MDKRRMCPHCRAFITADDKVCPYCGEKVGARAIERRDPGALLGGFIPAARFTTTIILLINFGLYIVTALYSMRSGAGGSFMGLDGQTLVLFGAKFRPFILDGEWWRLVTAGFLHGGAFHIFMNSWILFDLGAQVEELFGTARYIVMYFVATVVGFAASTFWSPYVSVGASAGVLGLVGAMIAFSLQDRTGLGSAMRGMYVRWAVYILILGLLPGLRIDNAAHIGGLVGGFVIAYIAGTPRLVERASDKVWTFLAYASVFTTAYCFLQMYLWFMRN